MSDEHIGDPTPLEQALVGNDQPITSVVQRGQAALVRLEQNQTWADYVAVIVALAVGREVCRQAIGQVKGRHFNEAMGRWLRCYGFDRIHKADRSRMLRCADHLPDINAWRAELPLHEQLELNHPRVVFRRWTRSLQEGASKPPKEEKPPKEKKPAEEEKPSLDAAWIAATDSERTDVLRAFGYPAFKRVMPSEWRPDLEREAGGQYLSRAKGRHPNVRLKHLDKAKLRLVGGTESTTPH
jgi:hypothetical protein